MQEENINTLFKIITLCLKFDTNLSRNSDHITRFARDAPTHKKLEFAQKIGAGLAGLAGWYFEPCFKLKVKLKVKSRLIAVIAWYV